MASISLNRVKTIMKTSDGVDHVNKEVSWLLARATEMFIRNLSKEAYETTNNAKKLEYDNLVNVIHNRTKYEFLHTMVPKRITVREYRELMDEKKKKALQEPSGSNEKRRRK